MLLVLPFILTLALIIYLSYRRVHIVAVSVFATVILCLLTQLPVIETLKTAFMPSAASYIQNFFLLFFISAMFGKVMELTGAASSIARFISSKLGKKYAIIGVMISGSVLVYGGVASLVVAFTLYPIALSVFQKANLPRKLIPGAIAGSCFTFAASDFPGTPQTMNVLPTTYLGTDTMAAPLLGIMVGIFTLVLAYAYMLYESKKANEKGLSFQADEKITEMLDIADNVGGNVNPLVAVVPIITIIILLNVFKIDVLICMLIGTILCAILLRENLTHTHDILEYSARSAGMAAINTGIIIGYGAVVKSSAGFQFLIDSMTSLNASPLLSFGLATTVLSGVAGSGSGGLGITLTSMAQQYLDMGLAPQVLHRVGAIAAIGLDSLPHNGAIITLLTLCGMTHKESYKPIFITTVVITTAAMFIAILLGNIMYPIV